MIFTMSLLVPPTYSLFLPSLGNLLHLPEDSLSLIYNHYLDDFWLKIVSKLERQGLLWKYYVV
jgi:hypothetical protein